jgi:type IV pilus assembly protein PilC
MPIFIWKGKDPKGRVRSGEMEVASIEIVRNHLERLKITPIKVKKKPKDLFENIPMFQPKVKTKDVILFARQFSTMIDAGLPIIQCLDILVAQQDNVTFKKMLREIKESVEQGGTLAESLKKYPKQFDDLFVNMIAAGEAGGILDTILRRLSAYLEKAAKLKAQIKGAMTYPIITLAIAILVLGVILILPNMSDFLLDLHQSLAHQGFVKILVQSHGYACGFHKALCIRSRHISSRKIAHIRCSG